MALLHSAGDLCDKNNYRPIALSRVASKIFENVLLSKIDQYLYTCDNQFGFKKGVGTETCVYFIKEIVNFYLQNSTSVYLCFIDASKAFDRINHVKLFTKLMQRNVPPCIVRILIFWYIRQRMTVIWGNFISEYFNVSCGVRQGGILSPRLYTVYMDDLSKKLNTANIGCCLGSKRFNHALYADDLTLLSSSIEGLQKILDIYKNYADEHDIKVNAMKSKCLYILARNVNFMPGKVKIGDLYLDISDNVKYLGHVINRAYCDDCDIKRQTRLFYCRANILGRNFSNASFSVKKELFGAYCSNFYCSALGVGLKLFTMSYYEKIRSRLLFVSGCFLN